MLSSAYIKRPALLKLVLTIICLGLTLVPVLVFTYRGTAVSQIPPRTSWPTTGWRSDQPENQGVDSATLSRLDAHIQAQMPHIYSVLVVRHGYLVFEKYYRGQPELTYEVASVTKSVTSALVGIALHEKYLHSLDQTIVEFFPEYKATLSDPRTAAITVRDVLTMTSGWAWSEQGSWSWPKRKEWMGYILNNTLSDTPGTTFNYNTPSIHLLSGIIERQSGLSLSEFAERYLFKPIGMQPFKWETDPQGYNNGGRGLFLNARDMAKLGYLYLNNGSWDGKQIVPAEWVQESTQRHNDGGFPEYAQYGYLWWITDVQGHSAYFAAGYGGQLIYVVPALDIVVVVTSGLDKAHPENKVLITDYILPALQK